VYTCLLERFIIKRWSATHSSSHIVQDSICGNIYMVVTSPHGFHPVTPISSNSAPSSETTIDIYSGSCEMR